MTTTTINRLNDIFSSSELVPEEESDSSDPDSVEISNQHDTIEDSRRVVSRNSGAEDDSSNSMTIGKRESRAVFQTRLFVFVFLTLTMIGISIAVYQLSRMAEIHQFEMQFGEDANKVLQAIGLSLDFTLEGIDAMAVGLVSTAKATHQVWPYVTIPNFGTRASKIQSLTDAIVINLYNYVPYNERGQWEEYSATHGYQWVDEILELQKREGIFQEVIEERNATNVTYWNVLHDNDEYYKEHPGIIGLDIDDPGPFLPMWQTFPLIPEFPPYNWDLYSTAVNESITAVLETHQVSLSEAYLIAYPNDTVLLEENQWYAEWFAGFVSSDEEPMEPVSDIYYPILPGAADHITIHKDENKYSPANQTIGGFLAASIYWRDLIKGILPEGSNGIRVVFENSCNPTFTYQINGPAVQFLGVGDHHEDKYDHAHLSTQLLDLSKHYSLRKSSYTGVPINGNYCPFTLHVYPSSDMEEYYMTNKPTIYTGLAILIFLFTSAVFIIYDCMVERRQKAVMQIAVKTSKIVSSLFPSNVRDRLYEQGNSTSSINTTISAKSTSGVSKKQRQGANGRITHSFFAKNNMDYSSPPIADLFSSATIIFADLANFTAWSSSRDPQQVFHLLETIYCEFDRIAERRSVFKIETIGDCYVAVAGVPEPLPNHAVIMARFASNCRDALNSITRDLERILGPGTSDLALRIGLHSGPVTAGVLRGEKSRFQLFGDTVNTAARMESNGKPNKIQVSQKTADLLIEAGKGDWVTQRKDLLDIKGKGKMQAYWVEPRRIAGTVQMWQSSNCSLDTDDGAFGTKKGDVPGSPSVQSDTERMIDWCCAVFEELLKTIVASRGGVGYMAENNTSIDFGGWDKDDGATVRDEILESIAVIDSFSASSSEGRKNKQNKEHFVDPKKIVLPPKAVTQLRSFITVIAQNYHTNAFHNFDHAIHVAMSTKKLLQRITSTANPFLSKDYINSSFRLESDPLLQISLVFVALIHDVDHPGVPNSQVLKENPSLATKYPNGSVSEQNSVDVAFNIFRDTAYSELHACFFETNKDVRRFRQLVINGVMATDIFDPELKNMRDSRWKHAFSESNRADDAKALDQKTAIVLEHVIQASDVCHTMQHWTVYQRWNRRLFQETYDAYKSGRGESPTEKWYEGELWFFDNYVIPLAKKLDECQVFGASSHEFLDFANENRLEWEQKGRAIVQEMKEAAEERSQTTVAEC